MVANAGRNDHLELFHNQMQTGNWIGIQLEGVASNRDAIGARIHLWDDLGQYHMDEVSAGSGYASQNSNRLHFGLGEASRIDSAFIKWPNGNIQRLEFQETSNYYYLKEGDTPTLINKVTNTEEVQLELDWKIFPNPVKNQLELQLPYFKEDYQVLIYNSLGQQVYSRTSNGASQQSIFVNDLQSGIYTLTVKTKAYSSSKLFVKQ